MGKRDKWSACAHSSAVSLHVDNHGAIYPAAGYASAVDEAAWCPSCGALRVRYSGGWKSPMPGARPAEPSDDKPEGGR